MVPAEHSFVLAQPVVALVHLGRSKRQVLDTRFSTPGAQEPVL
jgi:hypothetical protein